MRAEMPSVASIVDVCYPNVAVDLVNLLDRFVLPRLSCSGIINKVPQAIFGCRWANTSRSWITLFLLSHLWKMDWLHQLCFVQEQRGQKNTSSKNMGWSSRLFSLVLVKFSDLAWCLHWSSVTCFGAKNITLGLSLWQWGPESERNTKSCWWLDTKNQAKSKCHVQQWH